MGEILAFLTLRSVIILASTAFSILFLMLITNIITVDEVVTILNLSPDAATAFKTVIMRVQEVSGNILDIISQLLNKLFGWAGLDIDLHKISVHTDSVKNASEAVKSTIPAGATDSIVKP